MDCINKTDFTDDNTILYGHNMKDGSMFGSFQQMQADTAMIYLYTEEGMFVYEIIDNLDVTDEKYFRTVYSKVDFDSLREAIAEHTGKELAGDHLLTLSTCNGNDARRHLFICSEVGEYDK